MPTISSEESIFDAALQLPGADRNAYLAAACGADAPLRRRVEALLSAFGAGEFLELPVADLAATALLPPVGERAGDSIGPYKLLEQIGEGGMGLVFMAEQTRPLRRRVALKIIKPGLDTRSVIARFEAERQALALMDHPNIARVYDAGATEGGRPYFVMELVRGAPITDYCRERGMGLRERLELFIKVCEAVQHAHQKGVIHRDLKPTNILVSQTDTAPLPKVIDFGVAKATSQQLTERTLFTHFAQIIGTPLYMSPEQADLGNQDVDTRSDVYSLGVVLYELLTGVTPFDGERLRSAGADEMRRIIREEDPPRPSTRATTEAVARTTVATNPPSAPQLGASALEGELDWIIMKALDKDRRRRYQTARELGDDLERHLRHDAVLACPPTLTYQLSKVARRHRSAAILAASVLMCILAAAAAVSGAWMRQRAATQRALVERDEQRYQRYVADMNLASHDYQQGRLGAALGGLRSYGPSDSDNQLRNWEWYFLVSQCHEEVRCLTHHDAPVTAVAYSPDGRHAASGGHDGLVIVWAVDADAGSEPRRLVGCKDAVSDLAWDSSGDKLAASSYDGVVTVWDVQTSAVIRRLTFDRASSCRAVAWNAHDDRLAAAMEIDNERGTVVVWDATDNPSLVFQDEASPIALAWSHNGKLLAYATDATNPADRHVVVHSLESGQTIAQFETLKQSNLCLEISPDGKLIAIGKETDGLSIYDAATGQLHSNLSANAAGVSAVRWSPDGQQLASGGADGSLRVWNIENGALLRTFPAHELEVTDLDWSPDARTLVSASTDRTVKLWRPDGPGAQSRFSDWVAMDVDPTGSKVVLRAKDPTRFPIVDAKSGEVQLTLKHHGSAWPRDAAFSPDGRHLAVASHQEDENDPDGVVVNIEENRVVCKFPGGRHVTWSPDGRKLAVSVARGSDAQINPRKSAAVHEVAVIDFPSGKEITRLQGPAWFGTVRWSPDGKYLAAFNTTLHVQLWHTGSWQAGPRFELHPESPRLEGFGGLGAIDWSPDARFLAAVSSQGRLCIWDVVEAREEHRIVASNQAISAVRWSPGGSRLATFADREISVWDPASGRQMMSTRIDGLGAWDLRWASDGKRLFARCEDATHCMDATVGYDRSERGLAP